MSVTNVTIPTTQSFLLVDTRTGPNKVLFLPTASTIQGRYLSIKDYYGNATNSSLTISTTGLDRIDQRGIRYTLASSFGSVMLLSDGLRSWNMLGLYEGGDTAIGGVAGAVSNGTVTATGGTVTTSGSYKIHSFTTVGTATFTLTSPASITAQVLVVGGGGSGGGFNDGGGGGAGGLVYLGSYTITSGSYTIVVGAGGVGTSGGYSGGGAGNSGGNSSAFGYTGLGGGGGGCDGNIPGGSGGCGGGGGYASVGGAATQVGGFPGCIGTSGPGGTGIAAGAGGTTTGGGGGGMGSAATNLVGGSGVQYSISGTAQYYAAGGGPGTDSTSVRPLGGSGIGGNGGYRLNTATNEPTAGAPNTGSGGGALSQSLGGFTSGAGGSGIVIIAYTTIFYNTWQYVRFTLVLTRGQYSTREWQMSEFTLKYQGSPVSYTGATISPVVGGGEDNPNLIDGNLGNKAFNTSISFTIYRASGFLFNAYTWATANDVPNRDPVRWIVDASQDNTNWTVLDNKSTADQTITTSRNTYVQDFTF